MQRRAGRAGLQPTRSRPVICSPGSREASCRLQRSRWMNGWGDPEDVSGPARRSSKCVQSSDRGCALHCIAFRDDQRCQDTATAGDHAPGSGRRRTYTSSIYYVASRERVQGFQVGTALRSQCTAHSQYSQGLREFVRLPFGMGQNACGCFCNDISVCGARRREGFTASCSAGRRDLRLIQTGRDGESATTSCLRLYV